MKEEFREVLCSTASNMPTGLLNLNDPNDKKPQSSVRTKQNAGLGEEYVNLVSRMNFG